MVTGTRTPTHVWTTGALELHVTVADLFALDVSAIVNSEQTDFYLSHAPATISGQIRARLGSAIQDELDALTGDEVLPPGTVLTTSGADRYQRIYHAGFHRPDDWLDDTPGRRRVQPRSQAREGKVTAHNPRRDPQVSTYESPQGLTSTAPNRLQERQADALHTVMHCVRVILADPDPPPSVAFPLLGSGLFGLDPALVAYEFAREVAVAGLAGGPRRAVWLAVRGPTYGRVLDPLVQGLIDSALGVSPIADLTLGIGYLDRFNQRQVRSGDPRFLAWMLTRYTELLLGYLLFRLAVAAGREGMVQRLIPAGQSLSFGRIRTDTQHLALRLNGHAELAPWPRRLVDMVLSDHHHQRRLLRLNEDRNHLAHGKAARSHAMIEADLRAFIDPDRWGALREKSGDPSVDDLAPWVQRCPATETADTSAGPVHAVLDRWTCHCFEYVVPETGRMLRVTEPMPG